MTKSQFIIQEIRMDKFLDWLQNTIHSVKEISEQEYYAIFHKIKPKAK